MNKEQRLVLFQNVFAPQRSEKVLFLVDIPHGEIEDTEAWVDRRQMAREWAEDFRDLVDEVELMEFQATGLNNSPIPHNVEEVIRDYDIILAMTQWSMTATVKPIAREGKIRGASMPGVTKEMELSALSADYSEVNRKALKIKELLDASDNAIVTFSTGHELILDLMGNTSHADGGDATQKGKSINLPSGETFIVPNESDDSQTKGIWPVMLDNEEILFNVSNNKITQVVGDGPKAETFRKFFAKNNSRKNVAELGIGCNAWAKVGSGIVLEEEKAGVHIAYGKSTHFPCGTVDSDVHQDIVYAKGCPIEAVEVKLLIDDEEVFLVKNCELLV